MNLTLFRAGTDPTLFALTKALLGHNLPGEFGPWQQISESALAQTYAGTNLDGLSSSEWALQAIERYGFYLVRSGFIDAAPSQREASRDDR